MPLALRAKCYEAQKENALAIEDLERLLSIQPDDTMARARLSRCVCHGVVARPVLVNVDCWRCPVMSVDSIRWFLWGNMGGDSGIASPPTPHSLCGG